MTRWTRIGVALGLAGLLASAIVLSCGGRPGSPGELPPLAPRPGPADPSSRPLGSPLGRPQPPSDAGPVLTPGPVSPAPSAVR